MALRRKKGAEMGRIRCAEKEKSQHADERQSGSRDRCSPGSRQRLCPQRAVVLLHVFFKTARTDSPTPSTQGEKREKNPTPPQEITVKRRNLTVKRLALQERGTLRSRRHRRGDDGERKRCRQEGEWIQIGSASLWCLNLVLPPVRAFRPWFQQRPPRPYCMPPAGGQGAYLMGGTADGLRARHVVPASDVRRWRQS